MRLSFRLLLSSLGLCAGIAPLVPALADPAPVIAVNREIGLSMTGTFRNSVEGFNSRTAESGGFGRYAFTEATASSSRYRTIGWTPGFQVDASAMFNAFGIENLYGALRFSLEDGQRNYKSRHRGYSSTSGSYEYSAGGNDTSNGTDNRGEIGKGFLLLSDTFLLTPFIQGGYITSGGDGDFGYGSGRYFAGAGLKADYALSSRLVLRGRFGWAEVLNSGISYTHQPRPLWEGGLGMDYRMTRRLHLTAGGDYSYISYGRNRDSGYGNDWESTFSYSSTSSALSNGLKLHAGLAWQF
ncbi:hypothetical protein [Gluconobacter kanchanaburiensis]|uniref:Outer membrane protein beta-barrel domain-containing protein n=1 Tax=Gluconobacter kanchanaburiensis NBRC 103587 TaxID=1307948 RepID=A0A511B5H4_9PROT|nr:hypothetical protein [Gluconobacter kanchanaburiensis]MBF0861860.1 hypothetical protein [Gluconobacter kanchanaburiensis]GBR67915.1 hypothetical protein AA103587_0535 [Gluconobacter kanchanaburiensis NBRC 103587]GEK95614.1 hypothetical protein GKA01_08110 [Gluconobacter kanchanaburiensis NBRC 103587]